MDANPILPPTRVCRKCGQEKPLTVEFWRACKVTRNRTGFDNTCRRCINDASARRMREKRAQDPDKQRQYAREYYAQNRDKRRRWQREYRLKNLEEHRRRGREYRAQNREHLLEYERQYRETNRDYFNQKAAEYRARYPERLRARSREFQKAHRAEVLVRNKRRRAREVNAPGQITKRDVDRQFRAQRGKCWYCLCDISEEYHIDHLIPLSRGGTNYANNIVLACPKCNLSKNSKLPQEWNGRLF